MNQPIKKNRRLCETIKLLNACKTGQEISSFGKDRNVKVKSKPKKSGPGTFSMIKFYQSIPSNVFNLISVKYLHSLQSTVYTFGATIFFINKTV